MADLEPNAPPDLTVDARLDPGRAALVSVTGELDVSNVEVLRSAVDSVLPGADSIIFDLSGLRFMDSAGIAVLAGAAQKVRLAYLRSPSAIVSRVIELTGLSDLLPVEP